MLSHFAFCQEFMHYQRGWRSALSRWKNQSLDTHSLTASPFN